MACPFPGIITLFVGPEALPHRKLVAFVEPLRETHILVVLARMEHTEATLNIVGEDVCVIRVQSKSPACLYRIAYFVDDASGSVTIQAAQKDLGMLEPHIQTCGI